MARFSSLSLVLFLGFIVGWVLNERITSQSYINTNPIKPINVPESAVWVGGIDGGVWLNCSGDAIANLDCQIFADVTGVLVEKGKFSPKDENYTPVFYSNGLLEFKKIYVRQDLQNN